MDCVYLTKKMTLTLGLHSKQLASKFNKTNSNKSKGVKYKIKPKWKHFGKTADKKLVLSKVEKLKVDDLNIHNLSGSSGNDEKEAEMQTNTGLKLRMPDNLGESNLALSKAKSTRTMENENKRVSRRKNSPGSDDGISAENETSNASDKLLSGDHILGLRKKTDNTGKGLSEKIEASQAETSYPCPVCEKVMNSAHSLTFHVKQHHPSNQSHTCVLCGKTLSSASSLDRHMLVHSGERPFKCKYCNMSFTTNGNMHRHMRTHAEAEDFVDSNKLTKESKPKNPAKRKLSMSSEDATVVPVKKIENSSSEEHEQLLCPVCGKTFLCHYGFQSHMDTHPNDPIRCHNCGDISANYSEYISHKCDIKDTENNVQSVVSVPAPAGFQELAFVDFSIDKFSLIAKSFCEQNHRRPSSAFHTFECPKCSKAFPCGSALHLHNIAHTDKVGTYCPSCNCDFEAPAFLQNHKLKHRSAENCSYALETKLLKNVKTNGETEAKKEDFLALLELQTKSSQYSAFPNSKAGKEREENFENISYFVHGKPEKYIIKKPDSESSNNDFADIQSIITLTSKTPVMPNMNASPSAACPASPIQKISSCSPESPLVADSANASPETPLKDEINNNSNSKEIETDEGDARSNDEGGDYSCQVCKQSFRNSNALKRHSRSHSQGGSTYSCHLCSYKSLDKSTLIRHLRTHNGERPFQCALCKYAFTTKANCERHVRKRHKKLSKLEIRSAMQYNPNMEQKAPGIVAPEISSTETVCKYCNVDFKFNRVLRHHLRSLHNSCSRKPFCCNICKLGFSTKNNCIRHVLKQHPEMRDKIRSAVSSNAQSDVSDQESIHFSDESPQKSAPENSPNSPEPLNLTFKAQINLEGMNDYNNSVSSEDIVSAVQGLVSLAQIDLPQEEPLDLAVHALDLSIKNDSASSIKMQSKPVSIYHSSSPPSNNPCTLDLSRKSNLPLEKSLEVLHSTPNLQNNFPTLQNNFPTPPPSLPTLSSPAPPVNTSAASSSDIPHDPYKMTFKIVNDKLSLHHRPFVCIYCSSRFTLKSNMERHIKRKHPEFARPTRSRNFIPSLTPNVQKPSVQTLSSKTRDALREVLSSKASSSFVQTPEKVCNPETWKSVTSNINYINPYMDSSSSSYTSRTHSIDLSQKSEVKECEIDALKRSKMYSLSDFDSDVETAESLVDLASVSSVIHTANSQEFKQYLKASDSEKTVVQNKNLENLVTVVENISVPLNCSNNSDNCNNSTNSIAMTPSPPLTTNTTDLSPSPTSSPSPTTSSDAISLEKASDMSNKKRSSYTESPNSVFCPFCSRKFPWSSSLRRHILTHTGQKPYKCPRCPIWFTTKSNCERHLVRKHGRNGDVVTRSVPERPYKCNLCPSSTFSTQGNLKKHYYLKHWTRTSLGYSLKLSETEIPDVEDEDEDEDDDEIDSDVPIELQSSLSSEENVKTNELLQTHYCAHCDHSFSSKEDLLSHVEQHPNLIFQCHLCSNSFKKRKECMEHLKTHPVLEGITSSEQIEENNVPVSLKTNYSRHEMEDSSSSIIEKFESSKLEVEASHSEEMLNLSIICAFCYKPHRSSTELKAHMKKHKNELFTDGNTCHLSSSKSQTSQQDISLLQNKQEKNKLTEKKKVNPKKSIKNSLLYLLPPSTISSPSTQHSSEDIPIDNSLQVHKEPVQKDGDDTDLIKSLLDIQDSKIIDEMLESADSAARLLGVKKV